MTAFDGFGKTGAVPSMTAPQMSEAARKVLRNTYALLALTLVPTALGAWVAVQTGFMPFSGLLGAIVFLAAAFGFIWVIERNRNSGLGVVLLLAFTFFMGLMLGPALSFYLALANGPQIVMAAFFSTAAVFAAMATLGTMVKRDLSSWGKYLLGACLALIAAMLVNILLQSPLLMVLLSMAATVLFSIWLIFDVNRIVRGGETSYVSATLGIYLSLFNIFQHLLALFGMVATDD